jgi:hypothetical protein
VNNWAATDFYKENFTADNKIDVIDELNQAGFALKFLDLPDYGNVGSLANGNIDAVRWQYGFFKISANYTVSVSYEMLDFSMTSFPQLRDLKEMNTLFDLSVSEPFNVQYRNFADVIRNNYVGYIVYNVNRFDKKILSSNWVQPIYSNDQYIILKIKTNHPYSNVLEPKNPG